MVGGHPIQKFMRMEQIDPSFVARPAVHVEQFDVGGEVVLVNGWRTATALNPSAAALWRRFSGHVSLSQIADSLSEAENCDRGLVLADTLNLARQLGALGLLAHVEAEVVVPLEPDPTRRIGDRVGDFSATMLSGDLARLSDVARERTILVAWNPYCGYCSSIAATVGRIARALDDSETALVLLALGDARANEMLAQKSGINAPILMWPEGADPFLGAGTPSALLLDDQLSVKQMAWGNRDVPALLADAAGVDARGPDTPEHEARYLLEDDGLCAAEVETLALGTVDSTVFQVGEYHVGFRGRTERTNHVLYDLFRGQQVADDRAGFSYNIQIGGDVSEQPRGARPLSFVTVPGRPAVRSQSPARVVRALLWDMQDRMGGTDRSPAHVRVSAVALVSSGGALLLPRNIHGFGQRLVRRLDRIGLHIADVPHPEIDLERAEVVLPELTIDHDAKVLADLEELSGNTPSITPGRYPLFAWGSLFPGEALVNELSVAQAAAANVSLLVDERSPCDGIAQLAGLFTRIQGFGYWYHSEREFIESIEEALNRFGAGNRT